MKRKGFTLIKLPSSSSASGGLRRANAFTLIELLVVISVIGLLASIVLVSLNSARAKARDAKRLTDLAQIKKALELYYDDNGSYPNTNYNVGPGQWRTQCASSDSWVTPNLPADQVIKDIYNGKGLAPTYISPFPSDPILNAASSQNCYNYTSNGTDYKLIDTALTDMTLAQINQYPSYKDPARNDTTNTAPCTSFADYSLTLAIW